MRQSEDDMPFIFLHRSDVGAGANPGITGDALYAISYEPICHSFTKMGDSRSVVAVC